jgi:hypothetical protein
MSFWKRKSEKEKETSSEIKREASIDETDPSDKGRITVIEYGTNMPIDLIYASLQKDNEKKGYDDALSNPDTACKDNGIALLKSNLELKFRQIRRKYNDELQNVNSQIASLKNAGLTDVRVTTRKEIIEAHLEELNHIETDLAAGKDYTTVAFRSYERGFLRGLAAIALNTLNISEQ